jgi:hypothetical protein
VRIETRWRATGSATQPTTKAKALYTGKDKDQTLDTSDLLIEIALVLIDWYNSWMVGNPYLGITSGLPMTREQSSRADPTSEGEI